MTQNMTPQLIAALANLPRLNEGEGLLLALHPDFILMVRSGMNEDKRGTAAEALLSAAEGLPPGDGESHGEGCGTTPWSAR